MILHRMHTDNENGSFPIEMSPACGDSGYLQCQVALWLWKTVPFGLLAFGTVGNILSIIVLSRHRLRKRSITMYLICLAVSDLVFLWTALLRNTLIQTNNLDIKTTSVFQCKIHQWVATTAVCCSVWLLVLLTIERLVITKFPLTARRRISRKNALVAIGTTFATNALICVHYVLGMKLQKSPSKEITFKRTELPINNWTCGPSTEKYTIFLSGPWPYIFWFLYSGLPLTIILTGNILIAITVLLQKRRMQPIISQQNAANLKRNFIPTKILFLVSAVFFITTFPLCIGGIILQAIYDSLVGESYATIHLIRTILYLLFCTNFTVNFFLYCMSGSQFRKEFKSAMYEIRVKMCQCLNIEGVLTRDESSEVQMRPVTTKSYS